MEQEIRPNSKSEYDKTSERNRAIDPETEIRNVVNRHVQNKDDVISEEEFKNLKVGVPLLVEAEQTSEEDKLREKEQVTPWNILNEDSDSF